MAKVGMPKSLTSEAATSSCVERGFEAQRTTSAPPALRVMARFAVSVVTCRQAAILTPLRGFFLEKFSFMRLKTGMSISAHSILFLPFWLKAMSFTSYLTHYLRVIGFYEAIKPPPSVLSFVAQGFSPDINIFPFVSALPPQAEGVGKTKRLNS